MNTLTPQLVCPLRTDDIGAHKRCTAAHFVYVEIRALPVFVKIANKLKAPVSHPIFDNPNFGHVVSTPRPVNVYVLCIVSGIAHIAVSIQTNEHFKTKMR